MLAYKGERSHLTGICNPSLMSTKDKCAVGPDGQLLDASQIISFTFEAWTNDAQDPYLSITGHYISPSAANLFKWELRCEQLAFHPIKGRHSGVNMAKIITRVIDRYNIRTKVDSSFVPKAKVLPNVFIYL